MIFGKKCVLTPMTQKDISITLEWVNDPEYRYWNGTVFPISEFEHYDFITQTSHLNKCLCTLKIQ